MNRYYLQPGAWTDNTLTLTGEEGHHASRVMRQQPGEQIEIFDGEGKSAVCEITHLSKGQLDASILTEATQAPPSHTVTLCQAIPKGGNMELIIQKAVELGTHAIKPLITAHTVAKPGSAEKKHSKWQRIALEACKQCGQNHLPVIHPPRTFSDWLQPPAPNTTRIIAALDPNASPFKSLFKNHPPSSHIELLIGPEGDFTPGEYQQAYDHSFTPVSLGSIILRVETATLYCLSVLKHELDPSA